VLAYVFRHWPRLTVSPAAYEGAIWAFHQAVAGPGVPGLISSTVFRVARAPWLPAGRTGYEDWYLLEDSAAIDGLNEAAVAGTSRDPHNRVAGMVQSGLGALYRLARGEAHLGVRPESRTQSREAAQTWGLGRSPSVTGFPAVLLGSAWQAAWFPKPRGMSYDELYRLVEPLVTAGRSLWRRQMVLGPPPEFGLLAPGSITLPPSLAPMLVTLERLWPHG